jgi:sugar phosphate isomerase/epimerase
VGRRVLPGEGVFELERFCDVMRAKGFEGVVSCEILSDASRRMELAPFAAAVYESCSRYWL